MKERLRFVFCGYPFSMIEPDHKKARQVIDKIKADKNTALTMQEATTLLDYVVNETRQRLDTTLKKDFERTRGRHGSLHGIKDSDYLGYCGFSQVISGQALKDIGLNLQGVALHSMYKFSDFKVGVGHVLNTIELNINGQKDWFLIDVNSLDRGYTKLTHSIAHEYLKLNFRAEWPDIPPPVITPKEAFSFLTNPPPHKYAFDSALMKKMSNEIFLKL